MSSISKRCVSEILVDVLVPRDNLQLVCRPTQHEKTAQLWTGGGVDTNITTVSRMVVSSWGRACAVCLYAVGPKQVLHMQRAKSWRCCFEGQRKRAEMVLLSNSLCRRLTDVSCHRLTGCCSSVLMRECGVCKRPPLVGYTKAPHSDSSWGRMVMVGFVHSYGTSSQKQHEQPCKSATTFASSCTSLWQPQPGVGGTSLGSTCLTK